MTPDDAVVKRALERYGGHLARLPNVVGVGVGELVLRLGLEPTPCVAVYVSQKVPRRMLRDDEAVPETLEIDHERVRTRVIEVGSMSKEGGRGPEGFGKESG